MRIEQAFHAYDRTAESYAETNPHVVAREGYEWPMVRSLLPDVDGLCVLDAGTGAGYYAARLAALEAEVVGVDASEGMLEEARDRHGKAPRSGTPISASRSRSTAVGSISCSASSPWSTSGTGNPW